MSLICSSGDFKFYESDNGDVEAIVGDAVGYVDVEILSDAHVCCTDDGLVLYGFVNTLYSWGLEKGFLPPQSNLLIH